MSVVPSSLAVGGQPHEPPDAGSQSCAEVDCEHLVSHDLLYAWTQTSCLAEAHNTQYTANHKYFVFGKLGFCEDLNE